MKDATKLGYAEGYKDGNQRALESILAIFNEYLEALEDLETGSSISVDRLQEMFRGLVANTEVAIKRLENLPIPVKD